MPPTFPRRPSPRVRRGGSAQEKPAEGEVVSVGNGAIDEKGNRMPMDVKAGDRILFGKWSGTEVKINGEDMLIMKESDILGIMS